MLHLTKKELQKKIDLKIQTPENMREIAESYLRGDVIQDQVAAEGWLQKVIDTEDEKEAFLAMFLLAKQVLKIEKPISSKDLQSMRIDFEKSSGEEKQKLKRLLELIEQSMSGETDD